MECIQLTGATAVIQNLLNLISGYIGEFEIIDDHRAGKIVVNLTGRLNKVSVCYGSVEHVFKIKCSNYWCDCIYITWLHLSLSR